MPVPRSFASAGTAKRPVASVPQTPESPWTATAPIGSSMPIRSTTRTPTTAMKALWGIRVEDGVETAGLDVSEHGMWGYPEFYIPVPGGYGTEAHAHLSAGASRSAPPRPAVVAPRPTES